jgi:hypothetical protein
MRDDDDDAKPTPDSDRAAILARRKQFIALALSGLTSTAACTDGGEPPADKKIEEHRNEQKPQVCLTVISEPQPCLSVAPDVDPEPPRPQVCLRIARPDPDPETSDPPPPEPKPEPAPRPCLKKAAPHPCLKMAPDSD